MSTCPERFYQRPFLFFAGFGEAFSAIGVREPQPRASEVFTTFGEYHRVMEKKAYDFIQSASPVSDEHASDSSSFNCL
jgi:hypothetical protein